MNNTLHVIYGYVNDVSVSNFEELSTINHDLKSSNLRPDIISVCYGGEFCSLSYHKKIVYKNLHT
jgi:hypothetical protein